MHLDSTDDPRPAARARLAEVVADLEREAPPRVILAALVDAARRMALRIEDPDDPVTRPSRRGGRS
jgi:hypothetical protein